jgi:hypothetical protein
MLACGLLGGLKTCLRQAGRRYVTASAKANAAFDWGVVMG